MLGMVYFSVKLRVNGGFPSRGGKPPLNGSMIESMFMGILCLEDVCTQWCKSIWITLSINSANYTAFFGGV